MSRRESTFKTRGTTSQRFVVRIVRDDHPDERRTIQAADEQEALELAPMHFGSAFPGATFKIER